MIKLSHEWNLWKDWLMYSLCFLAAALFSSHPFKISAAMWSLMSVTFDFAKYFSHGQLQMIQRLSPLSWSYGIFDPALYVALQLTQPSPVTILVQWLTAHMQTYINSGMPRSSSLHSIAYFYFIHDFWRWQRQRWVVYYYLVIDNNITVYSKPISISL